MHITVNVPFNWVTSILVPTASILVSSGIAIGLAVWQTRRARKSARLNTAGQLAASLLRIQISTDVTEMLGIWTEAIGLSNTLELGANRRDRFMLSIFWTAANDATSSGTPDEVTARIRAFAPKAIDFIQAWQNGQLSEAELRRTLPKKTVEAADAWSVEFNPKTWPGF